MSQVNKPCMHAFNSALRVNSHLKYVTFIGFIEQNATINYHVKLQQNLARGFQFFHVIGNFLSRLKSRSNSTKMKSLLKCTCIFLPSYARQTHTAYTYRHCLTDAENSNCTYDYDNEKSKKHWHLRTFIIMTSLCSMQWSTQPHFMSHAVTQYSKTDKKFEIKITNNRNVH